MAQPILATVAIAGPLPISVSNVTQTVGFVIQGLVPGNCGTPAANTVRICEGFAESFRTKNLSFFVGDNNAPPTPGNATFSSSYIYPPGAAHYPADIAQNIPGVLYNTESLFQWQNDTLHGNGPHATNPPAGFGLAGSVADQGFPL